MHSGTPTLAPATARRNTFPVLRHAASPPAPSQPTVRSAWARYLQAQRSRWSPRHFNDHLKLARPGGREAARGTDGRGVTIDMPLVPLMHLRLGALDEDTLHAWAAQEARSRPASTRLAWRLLMGFMGWCARQPDLADVVPSRPAPPSGLAAVAPRARPDALRRDQLRAWFQAVRALPNRVVSTALQVMLLTGARAAEVLALRWADVDTRSLCLRVGASTEGVRTIALTPAVHRLLGDLPRRNAMVFSSTSARDGAIALPRKPHVDACAAAGLPPLSLLGLRRSFTALSEWLDVPASVVAQIQGYRPRGGAPAPGVRPLALLLVHQVRIEGWITAQAGLR